MYRMYRRSPWVNRSVNSIARAGSKAWRLVPREKDAELDAAAVQPIQDFLNQPNDTDSFEKLLFGILRDILVFGVCFMEIQSASLSETQLDALKATVTQALTPWQQVVPDADAAREDLVSAITQDAPPTWLKVLPAYEIEAHTDRQGRITGYTQIGLEGQRIDFQPSEIVHLVHPESLNQIYGESPLEAVATIATIDILVDKRQKAKLENEVALDKIFKLNPETTRENVDRFVEQMAERFRGVRVAGSYLVTTEEVDTQEFDSLKDGEFLKLGDDNKTTIAQVLGVPLSVLGNSDGTMTTGAGGDAAWAVFIENTVEPLVQHVEGIFNNQILPRFANTGCPDVMLDIITEAMDDDQALEAKYNVMIGNGSTTPNEIRKLRGQDPLPDGLGNQPIITARGATLLKDLEKPPAPPPLPPGPGGVTEPPIKPEDITKALAQVRAGLRELRRS
jgi:HK97 family phage portal protein